MVDKEKLKRLLKMNHIKISSEQLDEAINIYINMMNFVTKNKIKRIFSFVDAYCEGLKYTPYKQYHTIFLDIVKMMQNNLLMYLDYMMVAANVHFLDEFDDYIGRILYSYQKQSETYKIDIRANTKRVVDDNLNELIIEFETSKQAPEYYIDIIRAFYRAYNNYCEFHQDLEDIYNVGYEDFIDMTYCYFMENNLLNTEPESVISFINGCIDNEEYILDKINLAGLDEVMDYESDNMITFIDTLYQNSKMESIKIR